MLFDIHFIRPEWFYLCIPIALYLVWHCFFRGNKKHQLTFIDESLANAILSHPDKNTSSSNANTKLIACAGIIAVFALAGPSFTQIPQPIVENNDALIILLDVSTSMNSTDIQPSRLIRAKQKVTDLLDSSDFAQTALIAYAADAYIVTPLTDDKNTIATHLSNLSSDIVRQQGSRIDRALTAAFNLFKQTQIHQGLVIALTDAIELDSNTETAIKNLADNNYRFSIIGVASDRNTPIPKSGGGFIADNNGNIILSKLNPNTLANAARLGNGTYRSVSFDKTDINQILNNAFLIESTVATDQVSDEWYDLGAYLSLLLIPLLLLCFRKGVFVVLPCFILLHSETSDAFDWRNLFLNKDQQAYQQFQQQDFEQARENFNLPNWQASSEYKLGNYQNSLESWTGNSATDDYNRGNTLAKLGDIDAAISAYENALSKDPEHADAKFNLELLKQLQQNGDQNQSTDSPDQKQQNQRNSEQENNNSSDNQSSQNQSANQSAQDQESQANQSEQNSADNQASNSEQQASEALQQALEQEQENSADISEQSNASELSELEQTINPINQATLIDKQWLDRIQDDPGGLLRRKFEYQDYINQPKAEENPW